MRIEKARQILIEEGVSGLIVDDPTDIFYLTGQEVSFGRLLIERESAHFFVDGRYIEAASVLPGVTVLLTKGYGKDSAFATYVEETFGQKGKLAFDAEKTPFMRFQELEKVCPHLVPLEGAVKELRQLKEPEEIVRLAEAAALGSEGYDYVLTLLKEGVREQDVAMELEIFWRRQGGEGLAFESIIAFGEGSSMPHYHSGERKLKKGDTVLIDIGVVLDRYHSDMTRVVFFGMPNPEMERVYHVVREAQAAAIELCKPGTLIKELENAARAHIEQEGYGDKFPHSLGHGVGLEVHEFPVLRPTSHFGEMPLAPGMVITIEPGVYLPGLGGVRLEDTVVITPDGHANLTKRPIALSLPLVGDSSSM